MRSKWTFSLLIGTLLSCPQAGLADALHVITGTTETQADETATGDTHVYQSNGTPFSFSNNHTLTSQNGYVLHLNGTDPLPGTNITNSGNMLVSGTGLSAGYGIFSTVYRGRPVSANIYNDGTIERIQLKETDGSSLRNNGTVGGTVLIGDNAYITNQGSMINKTTGDDDDNLISFGKNGVLNNGGIYFATQIGDDVYDELPSTNHMITTDKLVFTQNGIIHNGGTIRNNSIEMGDQAYIHNYMSPYEGEPDDTMVREIETNTLTIGNNSYISNNMGGVFNVNETFTTGDNTTIVNGADYELNLLAPTIEITIPSKTEGEEPTVIEATYPANDKESSMNVGNLTLGEANSLQNLHAATMTGQNISFKNDSSFINQGGNITLTAPAATEENPEPASSLTFLDNGSFSSESITTTYQHLDTSNGEITSTLYLNNATTKVDNWSMGNNGSIDLVGADITSKNLTMGDNASISGKEFTYTAEENEISIYSNLNVENSISLGNYGLIASENLNITADKILFQDNGTFENGSMVQANELTMGNEATITTSGVLSVPTTVGSTSRVYLYSASNNDLCSSFGQCQGGSIIGSLQKAEGSSDVQVVSSVESSYYGYLSGIIDVDSILIDKNSLQLSGDIKGVINMNSDTYLKFVGESVYIHDPIQRVSGATNTNLEIALDDTLPGERPFYETTNTVDVDHILISSGGLSITRPVSVQDITLGANAILKVTGNYITGDIAELDDEAVNTTFTIDVGTGNIFNSSGTITLDRVTLDSGIFNVNHTIRAIKGLHPGNQEEGIELGTDSVLNVNHDVYTNQLVRLSDALQPVTNTTVNLNQGTLSVDRNMDVDTLIFNGGSLKMNNKDLTNKVTIANDVTVGKGSTLSGNGMFEITNGSLTLENDSTLAVSTLKVEEEGLNVMNLITDVTTMAGSTIDLRASETDSDRISIAGTLNLGNHTKLIIRNISAGQEYEIISADSIIGTPAYFQTSFLWDNPAFRIENNSIYATVNGIKTFQEGISVINPSRNVEEVAKALDTINDSLTAESETPLFLDTITYADSAQSAASMMKQLSSESYGNTTLAAIRTLSVLNRTRTNVLAEIRQASDKFAPPKKTNYSPYVNYTGRSGGDYYILQNGRYTLYSVDSTNENYAPPQSYRTDAGGVWVKPYALMMSQDDDKGISGFDYDAYGVTAGFDIAFENLSLGIMGIFGQGELDQNDNSFKSDIDTYGFGLYGEALPGGHHFVDFYATYLVNANDTQRKISALGETAKASYDMKTYAGGLAYGYNIELGKHAVLIPKVGVDYAYLKTDDFTEKGSSAALKVENDSYQSIQTPLEITALFNMGTQNVLFTPELKARWAHEFGDTEASNKSQFIGYTPWMKAKGIDIGRDVFTFGAAATLTLGGQNHISFSYDYDFGSNFDAHTFNLGYTYAF